MRRNLRARRAGLRCSASQTQPDRMLQPSEVPGLMEAGFREGGAGGASGGSEKTGGSGGVATSNASSRNQLQEKQRRSLKNHIAALLSLLDRHPSSWPFRKPVSVTEAPDYYEVVKHPVDISSMRRKNKSVRPSPPSPQPCARADLASAKNCLASLGSAGRVPHQAGAGFGHG